MWGVMKKGLSRFLFATAVAVACITLSVSGGERTMFVRDPVTAEQVNRLADDIMREHNQDDKLTNGRINQIINGIAKVGSWNENRTFIKVDIGFTDYTVQLQYFADTAGILGRWSVRSALLIDSALTDSGFWIWCYDGDTQYCDSLMYLVIRE